MRTNRKYCRLRAFQMRIEPFSRNTVHLAAFSREAAQDRSPGWSEAKAWVRTARRQPRKGCMKTTSLFRRWIDPSCAARHTAAWASQTTKVDGIGNNRSAMHDAPALGASRRTPRLPRNTPNHHATARLVAHFSRKTAERKVIHITNKIVKPLILILLMETPEAPRREKAPKPCHIRT